MSYDDPKVWQGRHYSGMRVGGRHDWDYTGGRWQETKVAPDQWEVRFRSLKRRRHHAPVGSGAEPGTGFHWFLLAHQRVRKLDEDTYETFLEGSKWKVGHRKPGWRKWSTEYPEGTPARERIAEILEATARQLRGELAEEGGMRPAKLEPMLDPRVLQGKGLRSLDEYADDATSATEE